MEVTNRCVTIKYHINGAPKESDFEVKTMTLSPSLEAGSNDILVKNIYVSINPYQLNRMKDSSPSQDRRVSITVLGLSPGKTINAYGVGRVVEFANPDFVKGDLVIGFIGWEDYSLVRGGETVRKLDTTEFLLSYHVGILGLSGITAYGGYFKVCKPKKGEMVFISGASGSVGNIVGQYAKLFGCYVVGCAGTAQKVDLLTDKLGVDAALNYKEESDLKSALKRYFPDGNDIYFDNVSGEMLEAAIENMNFFGRVAMCGVISDSFGAKNPPGPIMINVVYKRITIQDFVSFDYMHDFADFISMTSDHLRKGRMHILEDISYGVESICWAFPW